MFIARREHEAADMREITTRLGAAGRHRMADVVRLLPCHTQCSRQIPQGSPDARAIGRIAEQLADESSMIRSDWRWRLGGVNQPRHRALASISVPGRSNL
jgi:hypothetical protein